MNSLKKSLVLACAASVLGFGVAVAQTDPAPGMAPAGDAAMTGDKMDSSMSKKKMSKKKHMKKGSMKSDKM